jgi:hypothetical protein
VKRHAYSVNDCFVSLIEKRELVSGGKVDTGRVIWQLLILGSRNMRHPVFVIAALATEILT